MFLEGITLGEWRLPSRLALAIPVSVVLHGGILALGPRFLFSTENGSRVHGSFVTASWNSANTMELLNNSIRQRTQPRLVEPPSEKLEVGGKIPVKRDRMLLGEHTSAEIGATASESEALPSFGARYFKGSELTQRPQPIGSVELSYPALVLLPDPEPSGSIILRLLIAETGAVDQVLVESSDLPEAFQDETVLRFNQARFTPGQIDGMEVKSQMRIEVTFSSGW